MNLQATKETGPARIQANVDMRNVLSKILQELNERFPNGGRDTYEYALAHFLHPFWKGAALKKAGSDAYTDTLDRLVREHKSTLDFLSAQKKRTTAADVQVPEEDAALLELVKEQEAAEPQTIQSGEPPIQLEIKAYERMDRPPGSSRVNVLQWWSASANQFPNLFDVAR